MAVSEPPQKNNLSFSTKPNLNTMELSDLDLQLLEAYLAGTLPEAERAAFSLKMETDSEFRQAVDQLLSVENTLEKLRRQQLRAYLREQEKQYRQRKQQRVKIWMTGIAATLIVALAIWNVVNWLQSNNQDPAPGTPAEVEARLKEIAAAAFTHYAAPNNMSPEATPAQIDGMEAYKRKQYGRAIPLLKEEYGKSGNKQTLFFLGIAYVAEGRGAEAVETLESCRNEPLIPQQENNWYLLLAYLHKGDRTNALALARQIQATPNHKFNTAALDIEKKMEPLELKK